MRDHDGEQIDARDHLHEADYREHPPVRWTRRGHMRAVSAGLQVDEYGRERDGTWHVELDGWDGER